jgi:excisionase family DNA binding protein
LLPEAALLLKVGVRALREWIKKGELKAVKRGRAYYILYDDILEFLKSPPTTP